MTAPTLPIRRVGIDTWRENVAFLHRDCPVVRAAGFQALSKVLVRANGRNVVAVLNVVDDAAIVEPRELGLGEEAFARLGLQPGESASIEHAEPPASIGALHRRIAGEPLGREDLHAIVRDIAAARYSKIELAAFVVATNQYELDREEVWHLTEAMIAAAPQAGNVARLFVGEDCRAVDDARQRRIGQLNLDHIDAEQGGPLVAGAAGDASRELALVVAVAEDDRDGQAGEVVEGGGLLEVAEVDEALRPGLGQEADRRPQPLAAAVAVAQDSEEDGHRIVVPFEASEDTFPDSP